MIGSVKVSRSIKELSIKIRDIQNKYIREKGKEITISEIEKELGISEEEITLALDSLKPTVSIYEETSNDDEGGRTFLDKLSTNIDEAEQITNKIFIKDIVSKLEERDKKIIMLRYYKNKTQTEVAKILKISQVQVSRIEKKILESIKKNI